MALPGNRIQLSYKMKWTAINNIMLLKIQNRYYWSLESDKNVYALYDTLSGKIENAN